VAANVDITRWGLTVPPLNFLAKFQKPFDPRERQGKGKQGQGNRKGKELKGLILKKTSQK